MRIIIRCYGITILLKLQHVELITILKFETLYGMNILIKPKASL